MVEFDIEKQRRGRLQLLMLILLPIGVVLLATFIFYTRIGMPEGTRNRGELVVPPLQLNELPMRNLEGSETAFEERKDQWTFLVMFPPQCDQRCRDQVWETRQTKAALGKYQNNIRRAWLIAGGTPDASTLQWVSAEHPDMQLLFVERAQWQNWVDRSSKVRSSLQEARFYLVDPRGFMMMYYLPQDTYKDVMTDMKFLLKGVE